MSVINNSHFKSFSILVLIDSDYLELIALLAIIKNFLIVKISILHVKWLVMNRKLLTMDKDRYVKLLKFFN